MKAIILAAWEGKRLSPFTETLAKPLIKIYNKSIIEHIIESIYEWVSEIIIVVKYKKELFIKELWYKYKNINILYKEQWEEKWTAAAIKWLDIDEDILILNWDSIFDKKDLKSIIDLDWYWCLVKYVDEPSKYWIFEENNSFAKKIIEKPQEYVWNLANLWVYKFSKEIFKMIYNVKSSIRWEYEITDAINDFISTNKFKLIKIWWDFIDISYSWDILNANSHFLNKLSKNNIKWTIEDWVKIKWNIVLEEWSIIKSWTYIEWNLYIGKNTIIWANTYIKWNTIIWDNCKIWYTTEIQNTSIWDNTNIWSLSYISNSVIWNYVYLWSWFITEELKENNDNIKVKIRWVLIDSQKKELWVIIWDNSKIRANYKANPGSVFENNLFILD